MDGGRISGLFNSLFGEMLLDKDCANILQDPNADPMDKDICQTFQQFNFDFPTADPIIEKQTDDRGNDHEKPDAQSLRDSILNKPSPHHSERSPGRQRQPKVDQDLDSQLAKGADPSTLLDSSPEQRTSEGFSSYTKVTITRRPDGTVEERRSHRDSLGNEEETTVVRDTPEKKPTRNKLSDWIWPKQ